VLRHITLLRQFEFKILIKPDEIFKPNINIFPLKTKSNKLSLHFVNSKHIHSKNFKHLILILYKQFKLLNI